MNWKVLVEQFLEGYHIRALHRQTFYPVQYDNLNVIETFGGNTRMVYPYRNIERLRDRPEDTWDIGRRLTFVFQLFPNVMIATFPDQTSVIVVDPIDVGHSRMTTYTLSDPATAPAPRSSTVDDDRERTLVERASLEDNAMSVSVQRGLRSGANAFLEFGRHESAIGHFHRTLDDLLGLSPGSR